jgi:hypothetical protein
MEKPAMADSVSDPNKLAFFAPVVDPPFMAGEASLAKSDDVAGQE